MERALSETDSAVVGVVVGVVIFAVAGQVAEKYFLGDRWQGAQPKSSGKGNFELRWLARHVVAQHTTVVKRQMRCNQIPRKMLHKLQTDHHRRHVQSMNVDIPDVARHIEQAVTRHIEGANLIGPAGSGQVRPAEQMIASTSNRVRQSSQQPHQVLKPAAYPTQAASAILTAVNPIGQPYRAPTPWEKDLLAIQLKLVHPRIKTSIAAIQAHLQKGWSVNEVVRKTVAFVFELLWPMLQAVFNLSVLYQREFYVCQQVLCTIAGALTRLFGSTSWKISLAAILAPGLREFSIRISHDRTKSFDRVEAAVCFVWSALLQSAKLNCLSEDVIECWTSIPNGMWGAGRSDAVPGLESDAASAVLKMASGMTSSSDTAGKMTSSDDSGSMTESVDSEAVCYLHPPGYTSSASHTEVEPEACNRGGGVSQQGVSAHNLLPLGISASEGQRMWGAMAAAGSERGDEQHAQQMMHANAVSFGQPTQQHQRQ